MANEPKVAARVAAVEVASIKESELADQIAAPLTVSIGSGESKLAITSVFISFDASETPTAIVPIAGPTDAASVAAATSDLIVEESVAEKLIVAALMPSLVAVSVSVAWIPLLIRLRASEPEPAAAPPPAPPAIATAPLNTNESMDCV
ncbi:hypothetical protein N9D23_12210, partial [Rubripirellula sp.]|nr:hypothetical protein [Rubripirellula sp.]